MRDGGLVGARECYRYIFKRGRQELSPPFVTATKNKKGCSTPYPFGPMPTVQLTYINNWQIIQKLINQILPWAWPEMKEDTKGK
jgi:hypothetical protein